MSDVQTVPEAGLRRDYRIVAARVAVALAILVIWEWAGRTYGHAWTSLPTLIFERLVVWAETDLVRHIAVTLAEMAIGLCIGVSSGVAMGLLLGRSFVLGKVLRPIIVGFYSVPLITMAPLLILWFGLDMEPKIVLVAISSFFLLFFNSFAGVQAIDRDLILSMRLMGATSGEEFRKVVAPGAMSWIASGVKIALPYAFAAAVTGELLAAREGMGSLISKAAAQFDMTGLYSALLVLTVMGVVTSGVVDTAERRLLRWRHATE
jgi:NitT/TauT family transport system permease protein